MRYQSFVQTCLITATLAIAQPFGPSVTWAQSIRPVSPPSQSTSPRPRLLQTLIIGNSGIHNFAVSSDRQTLAFNSSDRSVRIFKWRDGVQDLRIDSDQSYTWFSWVAISPDGQTLVTSRSDGTIQLRDISTGAVKTTLPYRSRGEGQVAIAADNRTLIDATGFQGDFAIHLWNLDTQQQRDIGGNWADQTAITPDGRILVAASSSGTASVWDLTRGQILHTFPGNATEEMRAIAISPDGQRVFVVKQDRLEEWSASGHLTRTLMQIPNTSVTTAIAISPNGQTLAISFGNYIQLRDLRTNRPLYNLPCDTTGRQVISFTPDGQFFFNTDGPSNSHGESDRLRIWQMP